MREFSRLVKIDFLKSTMYVSICHIKILIIRAVSSISPEPKRKKKKKLKEYCTFPMFSGVFDRDTFNVAIFLSENCPGFSTCMVGHYPDLENIIWPQDICRFISIHHLELTSLIIKLCLNLLNKPMQ